MQAKPPLTTNNHPILESTSKKEDEAPFYRTKKGRRLQGETLEGFERFWEAFAYKTGKAEAADAWYVLDITPAMLEQILVAAKREAANRPKLKAAGLTPKMAQGWLSGRRFEDEDICSAAQKTHRPRTKEEFNAMAKDLGIEAKPGESGFDFRQRVFAAMEAAA